MLACGTKHQLEIKSKTLKQSAHIKSTLLFYISLNVIKTFFFSPVHTEDTKTKCFVRSFIASQLLSS